LKFATQSNIAMSGGGARDLRFPVVPFHALLAPMFPHQDGPRRRRGIVRWAAANVTSSAEVVLWGPTKARPREARIGRFYEIDGWKVDAQSHAAEIGAGSRWFALLVQLNNNEVWARTLKERDLGGEQAWFADCVREKINETRPTRSVWGFIAKDNGVICI